MLRRDAFVNCEKSWPAMSYRHANSMFPLARSACERLGGRGAVAERERGGGIVGDDRRLRHDVARGPSAAP